MVLNELSGAAPAGDIRVAREWMDTLMATTRAAIKLGMSRVLRVDNSLEALLLAPDYPVARWRNDPEVDLESRRWARTILSKSPLLSWPQVPPKGFNGLHECDCRCGGHKVVGLGVAFLDDDLAVSLPSIPQWDASYVQVDIDELNSDGDLVSRAEKVRHASVQANLAAHVPWIKLRNRSKITDGESLVDQAPELLSALVLCESASQSISALTEGSPHLDPIVKRLFDLQEYGGSWTDGPFVPEEIPSKVSVESGATLNKYGSERTFRCRDGTDRLFSWHVRLTPGSWRIHFFPLPEERRILIGYVGPHLPTVSDPT
jgi:hypothetical protein